ncbi:bis(5'-nucleosyl)-tetraphosphatase [asymmetrical]-like [Penaeus japonicus]|uniref:bis(5'-nucleosyl)-tetraphosphatase [asymmetrical]-like n=1 Tax=Penaeus japonicus TaxID=27405 RepID=UPI001C70C84A|nr:bis(5'-nucleosyl)-tetraphosphatase [asymmetrical]-like [Penaeus japonicus]XP_042862988.1 bis(5'-nucleosyl)-tetraphosphatase [asymmetrical]-like [Penaeus japonicus]
MSGLPELRAAGLVIFRCIATEIQYLLMQASYADHHWSPPKGHVDPGESDLETALRETEEEAGLSGSDFTLIDSFKKELKYEVRGKPKTVIYWLAELNNGSKEVTLSEEHLEFRWLPLAEACSLAKYPNLVSTLEECEEFIKKYKEK